MHQQPNNQFNNLTNDKCIPTAESLFTSRWGKIAGFNKQIDQSHFSTGINPTREVRADLTEQILFSYKSCGVSDQHNDFIKKLSQESLKFLAAQRGIHVKDMREETLYNEVVADMVEKIYTLLASFAYQFNHTVGWTELFVTATKPGFVTEILRYSKCREPLETITNYRSRLSTRFVSLVVRGGKNTIEFLSLPVDRVLGLSKAELDYQPHACLEAAINGDTVEWSIAGQALTQERLEELCLELFATLIKLSEQEAESKQPS